MTFQVENKVCEAIIALLADESLQTRLSIFNQYLQVLEPYAAEMPPSLLQELKTIADIFNRYLDGEEMVMTSRQKLTDEQEAELVERLLTIYIELKGGGLIF